jgi:hypothetical protein
MSKKTRREYRLKPFIIEPIVSQAALEVEKEAERARVRLALEVMAVVGSEMEAGSAAAGVVLEAQVGSPEEGVEMAEVVKVEEATEAEGMEETMEAETAEAETEGETAEVTAEMVTRVEMEAVWEMVEEVDLDWEVVERAEASTEEAVSEADQAAGATEEEGAVPRLVGREAATEAATVGVEMEEGDSDLVW